MAVLGAIAERPTHGFAVASLFGPEQALGWVWRLPRPLVYREFDRLLSMGWVRVEGTEDGERGPARTVVAITPQGRTEIDAWLSRPVLRARDARSALMLKLALHQRAGTDPTELIAAQRAVFQQRIAGLEQAVQDAEPGGIEHMVALWRRCSTQAVLDFLDTQQP